jgi:hypothetical protein
MWNHWQIRLEHTQGVKAMLQSNIFYLQDTEQLCLFKVSGSRVTFQWQYEKLVIGDLSNNIYALGMDEIPRKSSKWCT